MAANSDMVTPLGLFFSPHKIAIEFSSTPFEEHGAIDRSDEIYEIRVHNVWIGHGFWAGLGSIFTGPLAGSSITHWWVEIETKNGHWYCAQWESTTSKGHYLCLSRQSSLHAVTKRGKWEACCENEDKSITTKYSYKVEARTRTIGGLIQMMKRQGIYHLVSNNCQHFGARVYQWI